MSNEKQPHLMEGSAKRTRDGDQSNSSDDWRKQKRDKPRFYQPTNQGPFSVWIESPKTNDKVTRQKVNPFKVGSIFCEEYKSIISIERVNNYRVEILLKTGTEANRLCNDPKMLENEWNAYIPSFRLERKGIVKGIYAAISNEEIKNLSETPYRIVEVERLNKRNRDINATQRWIPSETVVITFEGQALPSELILYKIKLDVNPFITNPVICYNCFKTGHVGKFCRAKVRCNICGEEKHNGECTGNVPRCSNCKGEHKSNDRNCPIYLVEQKVRQAMAQYNISMNAARKLVTYQKKPTNLMSKENFPEMKTYSNALTRSKPTEQKRLTYDSNNNQQKPETLDQIHQKGDISSQRKSRPEEVENGSQKNKKSRKSIEERRDFYKEQEKNIEAFIGNQRQKFENGIVLQNRFQSIETSEMDQETADDAARSQQSEENNEGKVAQNTKQTTTYQERLKTNTQKLFERIIKDKGEENVNIDDLDMEL